MAIDIDKKLDVAQQVIEELGLSISDYTDVLLIANEITKIVESMRKDLAVDISGNFLKKVGKDSDRVIDLINDVVFGGKWGESTEKETLSAYKEGNLDISGLGILGFLDVRNELSIQNYTEENVQTVIDAFYLFLESRSVRNIMKENYMVEFLVNKKSYFFRNTAEYPNVFSIFCNDLLNESEEDKRERKENSKTLLREFYESLKDFVDTENSSETSSEDLNKKAVAILKEIPSFFEESMDDYGGVTISNAKNPDTQCLIYGRGCRVVFDKESYKYGSEDAEMTEEMLGFLKELSKGMNAGTDELIVTGGDGTPFEYNNETQKHESIYRNLEPETLEWEAVNKRITVENDHKMEKVGYVVDAFELFLTYKNFTIENTEHAGENGNVNIKFRNDEGVEFFLISRNTRRRANFAFEIEYRGGDQRQITEAENILHEFYKSLPPQRGTIEF